MHAISIDTYVIYAYIRIQIIVEIKTITVVPVRVLPVRVLPVRVLLVRVLLVRVLLVRVLLVQSSPVLEIPYAFWKILAISCLIPLVRSADLSLTHSQGPNLQATSLTSQPDVEALRFPLLVKRSFDSEYFFVVKSLVFSAIFTGKL